jgi:hypothetical protein
LSDPLQQRIEQERPRLEAICRALGAEIEGLGVAGVPAPEVGRLAFRLQRDPASGWETLVGEWRDNPRQRQGQVLLHGDGSLFAEYDVLQPHPHRPGWFIEAMTAWGRGDRILSEARLLPMPE